ncbi:oligosaccharide flippase family protein [Devosia beringensis]|uniref:oligosaccharide flippase family protein n=1 Tax=Devosia beringensis TaxID=2657486 RepID=UPI00186B6454|nr:oligosaccharide flippase family protein [Devosia beringensis]
MSLKREVATGVVWSVIGNGANNIISFIVFAIIANVVSPTILGVASFAIVLVEVGRMLNTAGIPELLIQRPQWDDDYATVAFWVNITIAAMLTLVSCLAVAPIVDYAFASGSGIALIVLSACFLIDAVRVVQEAKLRREFNYRSLAVRGSIAGVLSGLLGVAMALTGHGLWALITQRLLHSMLMTALTWYASDWRPRFFWSTRDLGQMLSNGSRLLAVGLMSTLSVRLPDLLLGAVLGPVALAIFRVGSRGYDSLIQLIVYPVANASISGFSRVAATGSIASAYIRFTKFAALLGYPVFFGAAATAQQFVAIAFGENWSDASYVMSAMCMIVGPATLGYMLRPALTSLRRTGELLRINIFVVATVAAACLAGLPFGAVGMAVALVIRAYFAVVFNLFILRRELGIAPKALLQAVTPPFSAAIVMAAVSLVGGHMLVPHWPEGARLVVMIVAGAIAYPLFLWLAWRKYLVLALREIGEMFPKAKNLLQRITPQRDG